MLGTFPNSIYCYLIKIYGPMAKLGETAVYYDLMNEFYQQV